ncbi:MAG TPA: M24 family metallopeptidase, partial [Thermoanaerobaculia bacterium]|nr:M24 family metallopeptidase [Thermoanaerobaculia bacterium]
MGDRLTYLWAGLEERGCNALLVLARSAQDSDLAPFVGNVHLGESQLVIPRGGPAHLAYLTPMEREEAASTGLRLITPEQLDMTRWQNEAAEPGDLMARVAERSLALAGVSPGRVALAGHGQAGVIQAACADLARKGWIWVSGNDLVLAARKRKTASELAAIRAAAEGVTDAIRRIASRLAETTIGDGRDGELWLDGEPLTVARLRSEAGQAIAAHGLGQPKGNILAPGDEGGVPHSAGTQDRVLRAGESIVADFYPRGSMFADCTRTFCVGEPSPALLRAHALVLAALERA